MAGGFTKLFSSIVTSSIWCQDDVVLRVWIAMLATCDSDGIVEGSVPGFASMSRVTNEQMEHAIEVLSSPDEYSRTKDKDGRRIEAIGGGWQIVNYRAYRDKGQAKEGSRAPYMRNRRAAQASQEPATGRNALQQTVTSGTEAEAEAEKIKDIPSAAAPVKPKREPKVRTLGGYPEELNLAMGIWRDLRKELLAEEILSLFPNDPEGRFVAQVGTKGKAWEAWQKRRGLVTPSGVKVTDEHIRAAVRLWAETRYKLAKAGKNLSMPNLSSLINSADFEDALLRVAAPEVAHAV